jgi:hypothetical protein
LTNLYHQLLHLLQHNLGNNAMQMANMQVNNNLDLFDELVQP